MGFAVLDLCRPEFIQDLARLDVALPNLHGPFGEDGRLQGLLDYLRTPCCGRVRSPPVPPITESNCDDALTDAAPPLLAPAATK